MLGGSEIIQVKSLGLLAMNFSLPWFGRFSEHIQLEDFDKERDLDETF